MDDVAAAVTWKGLIAAAATVVVAGVLETSLGHGSTSSAIGDGLYAALVYLLVAFAAPRSRTRSVAAIALGLCVATELTQLTGASAAVVEWWGPARYLLGTTFQAVDLAAYAAAVVVTALVDRGRSTRVTVTTTSEDVGAERHVGETTKRASGSALQHHGRYLLSRGDVLGKEAAPSVALMRLGFSRVRAARRSN